MARIPLRKIQIVDVTECIEVNSRDKTEKIKESRNLILQQTSSGGDFDALNKIGRCPLTISVVFMYNGSIFIYVEFHWDVTKLMTFNQYVNLNCFKANVRVGGAGNFVHDEFSILK